MLKCRTSWVQIFCYNYLQSSVWKTFLLSLSNKYGHTCWRFSLWFWQTITQLSVIVVWVNGWWGAWLAQGAVTFSSVMLTYLHCPFPFCCQVASPSLSWQPYSFLCLFAWIEQLWCFTTFFYGKNLCKSLALYTGIISYK